MNYWKEAKCLLISLTEKDQPLDISTELKNEILYRIEKSVSNNNYLLAKLLIYAKITEENLLNFMFYSCINSEKLYNLYVQHPSKYARTFMFGIEEFQLPRLQSILKESEYLALKEKIEIDKLIENIRNTDSGELKRLFPSIFYFTKINPFSIK